MQENPEQQAANTYAQMFREEGSEEKLTANNFEILVTMMKSEGLKTGYLPKNINAFIGRLGLYPVHYPAS